MVMIIIENYGGDDGDTIRKVLHNENKTHLQLGKQKNKTKKSDDNVVTTTTTATITPITSFISNNQFSFSRTFIHNNRLYAIPKISQNIEKSH